MKTGPARRGKRYDEDDDAALRELSRERFDTATIAAWMHRTKCGISGALSKRKLSLKAARADMREVENVVKRLRLRRLRVVG